MRSKDEVPRAMTVAEVAKKLGICHQRVTQLEESALRKLRHNKVLKEVFKAWSEPAKRSNNIGALSVDEFGDE